MNKHFELWLDESGQFKDEAMQKEQGKEPSLVGGILIEKEVAEQINFGKLIDEKHTHAMEMEDSDKLNFVLPALEKLCELGAREVFFENVEYKDTDRSRELYLSIMCEGLIQLISRLDAIYESVSLEVYIAQRQDMDEDDLAKRRIAETEYERELSKRFLRKKNLNRIVLDSKTNVAFVVTPAHKSKKIQCADFACNTRLTRKSKIFRNDIGRIQALYETAWFFTLNERLTINIVKRYLTKDNISEAIFELYTSLEAIKAEERLEIAKIIVERMKNLSYRMLKSQLKQCSAAIVSYGQSQDDYEVAEKLYRKINDEIVTLMVKEHLPYEPFKYSILLWMADACLRQGDIIEARKVIGELETVQKSLGDSLEEFLSYYQLLEKKSLLCIDEFDYANARRYMKDAREIFEKAIKALPEVPVINERFKSLRSEYLGDALCMEIYAMLFMQREHPELYEEMCRLSDEAMEQYPDFPGELQRHLQYRSHIEMIHGDFEKALSFLFESAGAKFNGADKASLIEFLNKVSSGEQAIGCCYYLMYYLLILTEAKAAGEKIADVMMEALKGQKRLMEYGDLPTDISYEVMQEIDTGKVSGAGSGLQYHPMEIIKWKYATYLTLEGKYETAIRFYTKAQAVCDCNETYKTMKIIGLGIGTEKSIALLQSGDKKKAIEQIQSLIGTAKMLQKSELTSETKAFLDKIINGLKECDRGNQQIDVEALWKVSRYIAY